MNIMLVSVPSGPVRLASARLSERVEETFSAVLVEALVLSMTGGTVGIYRHDRVWIIRSATGLNTAVTVGSVLLSFGFRDGGHFLRLLSARQASNLNPTTRCGTSRCYCLDKARRVRLPSLTSKGACQMWGSRARCIKPFPDTFSVSGGISGKGSRNNCFPQIGQVPSLKSRLPRPPDMLYFTIDIGRDTNSREWRTGNLIVIVGPTAVGKTAVAIELAELVGGEIVSADRWRSIWVWISGPRSRPLGNKRGPDSI